MSDVLIAFHPPDASEAAASLSTALASRKYSSMRSLNVEELKHMTAHEVSERLQSCNSIIVLVTAGLFERSAKTTTIRKYVKLERLGAEDESHPLVHPVYNLPRLLRQYKRQSKPMIALNLTGTMTGPPSSPPASGLTLLAESFSASVKASYDEAIQALVDAKILPSASSNAAAATVKKGVSSTPNQELMDKIKQLEAEARGLKIENHRLLSAIAPIGMSQSSSAVKQADTATSASSFKRPETCDKGISLKGLKKLKEIAKELCAAGRFAEDRTFDIFYKGTQDYKQLTTTQFVSMWVKDPAVTGNRRLADCPDILDKEFIGPPTVFVSHAWRGSLALLLRTIFKFAEEKGYPEDTKFWLDMVAVNQHKDTIEERAVNMADVLAFKDVVKVCEKGTLVYLTDIPDDDGQLKGHDSTTANRGWCLYEWDWTLALHRDANKIHFEGMETQETLEALHKFDVGKSVCWSPLDQRRILEDMMKHHGSKVAFNEKLQRQLRENVVRESCGDGKKFDGSASRGISVRGLRKFEALLRDKFNKGDFASFISWGAQTSVSSFEDLKTQDVVYGWLRPYNATTKQHEADAATGGKRLADLPQYVDSCDIGLPQYMISHAWGGSIKKVFETVYSFFSDASEEDTHIFLDLIAVEDFDTFSVDKIVPVCSKGTIVVADMVNSNPALRILMLKDWLQTLKEHGRGALHLEGLSLKDRETLAVSIDCENAVAKKPEDKIKVLQDIKEIYGSLKTFDDKLRLQTLVKPLPYNVLHAEKELLLRRFSQPESQGEYLSRYNFWIALPPGCNCKQALCIVSGPSTGKSTLSAKICETFAQQPSGGAERSSHQPAFGARSFASFQVKGRNPAAVAGQAAERVSLTGYDDRCLAFHFLKSGDASSIDPLVILKSIACQLSPRIPKLAEHLLSLSPKRVDALTDIEDAMETLLSPIFSYEGELLIVIDGLDEADSHQQASRKADNLVVHMLRSLVPRMSRSTRFVISTRSEPCYSHGLDVKTVIREIFHDSVEFFDPQPRYGACLTYRTVVEETHLVDVLPSLGLTAGDGSASVEDVYKAFRAVFERQPPKGQRMIDLVSILAASRRYLSIRMLEEMDFKRSDLEELPGWGCLFYSLNGRISISRLLIDWLQSDRAKDFGVDLTRGHALLGIRLLNELSEERDISKYATDFAHYHQCQALSAGGSQEVLKQLAQAMLAHSSGTGL